MAHKYKKTLLFIGKGGIMQIPHKIQYGILQEFNFYLLVKMQTSSFASSVKCQEFVW